MTRMNAEDSDANPPQGGSMGNARRPVPPFSKLGLFSPFVLPPALAPAAVALFSPQDVLTRLPGLRSLVEGLVAKAPSLANHAHSTSYPEVALLTNVVMLAMTPVLALVFLIQSWVNYPTLLSLHRAKGRPVLRQYFVPVLAMPLWLVMLVAHLAIAGDPTWAEGLTRSGRGFFAFLASFLAFMGGMSLGCQVLNLRLFMDAYLLAKDGR